jgi:hypothetical protein
MDALQELRRALVLVVDEDVGETQSARNATSEATVVVAPYPTREGRHRYLESSKHPRQQSGIVTAGQKECMRHAGLDVPPARIQESVVQPLDTRTHREIVEIGRGRDRVKPQLAWGASGLALQRVSLREPAHTLDGRPAAESVVEQEYAGEAQRVDRRPVRRVGREKAGARGYEECVRDGCVVHREQAEEIARHHPAVSVAHGDGEVDAVVQRRRALADHIAMTVRRGPLAGRQQSIPDDHRAVIGSFRGRERGKFGAAPHQGHLATRDRYRAEAAIVLQHPLGIARGLFPPRGVGVVNQQEMAHSVDGILSCLPWR